MIVSQKHDITQNYDLYMWIIIYFGYKLNFQPVFLNAVNSRVPLPQDCDHVSQTAEEFYTVRCQVADMKNIYVSPADLLLPGAQRSSCQPLFTVLQESLDEVTIKDTLEGDNMYTCSQCGKKVRAEKR